MSHATRHTPHTTRCALGGCRVGFVSIATPTAGLHGAWVQPSTQTRGVAWPLPATTVRGQAVTLASRNQEETSGCVVLKLLASIGFLPQGCGHATTRQRRPARTANEPPPHPPPPVDPRAPETRTRARTAVQRQAAGGRRRTVPLAGAARVHLDVVDAPRHKRVHVAFGLAVTSHTHTRTGRSRAHKGCAFGGGRPPPTNTWPRTTPTKARGALHAAGGARWNGSEGGGCARGGQRCWVG